MVRSDVVIVITARLSSERLPGKVLEKLGEVTALEMQVLRARRTGFPVIVAVPEDEPALVDYARTLPVDRVAVGSPTDVVSRVYVAAKPYRPRVVIRGVPDAPFFEYGLTARRAQALLGYGLAAATRSWHPFGAQPVYGADEPAYSWWLVEHMLGAADDFEREHFGAYVDRRRTRLNLLYTPAPPMHLYRDLRLELDTPEDLALLRRVVEVLGPLASISSVVAFLEQNPELCRLNAGIVERTGPVTSFAAFATEHEEARKRAYPVAEDAFFSVAEGWEPVLCAGGRCLVGARKRSSPELHTLDGRRIRGGIVSCRCGADLNWRWRPGKPSTSRT